MCRRTTLSVFALASILSFITSITFLSAPSARAQQTLGGITGTVADSTGGVLAATTVTLVNDQTTLTRNAQTNEAGAYDFVNLPIGTYTLTFTHAGFQTQKIPSITVQGDRTATVNTTLKVGEVGSTVTVESTPLLNSVDTTNGYILEKDQIESVPLPTGSFTGLAVLSPGVSSELAGSTGVNNGLGNKPIWANGQRDTSNTFQLNGVDASNLFNGKSTSSVASARVVNNTGLGGSASLSSTTAAPIQSSASPYLAVGQALPTPPPDSIEEFRVNTSMYDAQQGSTSGAHIDMSTASGTNDFHGRLYGIRGTDALNAAPFFYNADPNIPAVRQSSFATSLHRGRRAGRTHPQEQAFRLHQLPARSQLRSGNRQLAQHRAGRAHRRSQPHGNRRARKRQFPRFRRPFSPRLAPHPAKSIRWLTVSSITSCPTANFSFHPPAASRPRSISPRTHSRPALPTSSPTRPSPTSTTSSIPKTRSRSSITTSMIRPPRPSHTPSPRAFRRHLDAGSQVASITNTQTLKPNLSVSEVFGFIREKIYSTIGQPFTPQQFSTYVQQLTGLPASEATMNTFGSNFWPGISIVDNYGNEAPYNVNFVPNGGTNIGSGSNSQSAFTGVFQNRFMPSANAIWTVGRHTITFGGSFAYTQLNTRDERTDKGVIAFADFSQFVQGLETSYSPNGFVTSTFMQGNANRYYRSKESGAYLQDKYQLRSNLSVTAGIRFDDHGGLTEKNGRLYNFEPSLYNYDAGTDTIVSNGLIYAGNNKQFPSKGVSDSTLTGRQWAIAPRVGLAWAPGAFQQ